MTTPKLYLMYKNQEFDLYEPQNFKNQTFAKS